MTYVVNDRSITIDNLILIGCDRTLKWKRLSLHILSMID